MESTQLQGGGINDGDGGGGGGGSSSSNSNKSSSSYMCRQSSTRWTPTSEQIRILKELYYNNGIRSPTADQIQRISARLRQHGKIEGKNVFYWFQNHKARERQKKRFTTTTTTTATANEFIPTAYNNPPPPPLSLPLHNNNNHHHHLLNWRPNNSHQLYPLPPQGIGFPPPSSSSSGVVAVGQIGNCVYGSVAMEKSFRDCSISPGSSSRGSGGAGHELGLVGVNPYSSSSSPFNHSFLDKPTKPYETLEEEIEGDEENQEEPPEIETLPLFPIHIGDNDPSSFPPSGAFFNNIKYPESSGNYYTGGSCMYGAAQSARASLELSLNSYAGRSMDLHH